MISFAQNAEDVVLARAFPAARGFYVDVGAGDPDVASVTRHFYDLGWTGINVDPRADVIERLAERRPRDTNLQVAAGAAEAVTTFFLVGGDPDLSTCDEKNAESLRAQEHQITELQVPVRTLTSIMNEAKPDSIDFLKIDVEGTEKEVLLGLDLSRWRPTVIIVEAVWPWSSARTDHEWRWLLEDAGYTEKLFDGINLFFLAAETCEEIAELPPASVLDNFVPASVRALEAEIDRLRGYVGSLEDEIDSHRRYLATVSAELYRHQEEQANADGYVRDLERRLGSAASVGPARPEPPRPLRAAVISSQRMTAAGLARRLAAVAQADHLHVEHPGDIDWSWLPTDVVLELDWPPTQLLSELLNQHRIDVVALEDTDLGEAAANSSDSGAAWARRSRSVAVRHRDVLDDMDATVDWVLHELGIARPEGQPRRPLLILSNDRI